MDGGPAWRTPLRRTRPTHLRRVLSLTLLCAVLVIICNLFIDRPVAAYVFQHRHARLGLLPLRPIFQLMAAPSLLPLPFSAAVLGAAVWRRLSGGPPLRHAALYLPVSLATLAATAAKDELKWMFGRPWPDSWIRTGVYAFHPFDTGWLYGSFPSGHTAYITAPVVVLWSLVPRYRPLWGGILALVMIGLVGAGYHFVGDVIAGLFTGMAAAAGTLVLLRESGNA